MKKTDKSTRPIKIRLENIEFRYSDNVVICKADARISSVSEIFYSYCFSPAYTMGDGEYKMSFNVKARARCVGTDIYDRKLGEKIALAKAENKAYDKMLKTIRRFFFEQKKAFEQCKKEYNDFFGKAVDSIYHNDDYVKRLTGEE